MARGDEYDQPDSRDDERRRDDRGPEDGDRRRDRRLEEARARVRMPATLLQLYGAWFVAVGLMWAVLNVIAPEAWVNPYFDWIEDMQKNQPAEKRQKIPPREDLVASTKVTGPIYGGIAFLSGLFMFIGGSKMKQLRGYPMGITGSIISIVPGMSCCCIGLLPGIWGLVVLMNDDVKSAFRAESARSSDRID